MIEPLVRLHVMLAWCEREHPATCTWCLGRANRIVQKLNTQRGK